MAELDAVERALERARAELAAPDATLERVWERLPRSAKFGDTPPQPNTWATLKATGTTGLIVAVALVGGGFALGFWAREYTRGPESDARAAAPSIAAAPPLATAVPPAGDAGGKVIAPPIVSSEPLPTQARQRIPAPARRASKPTAPGDSTQQELALLARAERALRNDDAALALALLAELELRFPTTVLAEERAAVRLMSHCVQKGDGAARAAQTFLREHSASVYASRLRSVCGFGATSTKGQNSQPPITGKAAPDTDGD